MEIIRIDETNQTLINRGIDGKRPGCKVCIYYTDVTCSVPNLKFRICQGCPRAAGLIKKNAVNSLFDHIKSFTISLLNKLPGQAPLSR